MTKVQFNIIATKAGGIKNFTEVDLRNGSIYRGDFGWDNTNKLIYYYIPKKSEMLIIDLAEVISIAYTTNTADDIEFRTSRA